MASKGSFFALSGNQAAFKPTTISSGGTYVADGPGLYWIDRTVTQSALRFFLPDTVTASNFSTVLYIKDIAGDAYSYPITISSSSGYLIDGATSLVLNTPYASATLVFNGITGWSQVA